MGSFLRSAPELSFTDIIDLGYFFFDLLIHNLDIFGTIDDYFAHHFFRYCTHLEILFGHFKTQL